MNINTEKTICNEFENKMNINERIVKWNNILREHNKTYESHVTMKQSQYFNPYDNYKELKQIMFFDKDKLSNFNGPAIVRYDLNGILRQERWFLDMVCRHPYGGMDVIIYNEKGKLITKMCNDWDCPFYLWHADYNNGAVTYFDEKGCEVEQPHPEFLRMLRVN